mmetsp:Transcript_50424/g.117690  ORF Transcript_50424/g.117690 Transcript_50424/m.117690 type:complete len:678 (-) Transcript_50424:47-2080(-)
MATATASPEASAEERPLPSFGTLDYGGGFKEVAVIRAIEEYLIYHKLDEPLEAFRRDVARAGLRAAPSSASNGVEQEIDRALTAFDQGQLEVFEPAWKLTATEEFRSSHAGRALEIRLRAHFAVFRARGALNVGVEPGAEELQIDLEPFRKFLSDRGSDEVCGDEAVMPLLALPFVRRPYLQPPVREVFTVKWLTSLRQDVEAAMRSCSPVSPSIYSLLEPSGGSSASAAPGSAAAEGAWQTVWAELFRIADASLDAAIMLSQGVPVPPTLITNGRHRLDVLREQVPGGLELKLTSQIPTSVSSMSPSRGGRSRAATAPPEMPRDVDFKQLEQFISNHALSGGPRANRERQASGQESGLAIPGVLRAILQRLASTEAPTAKRRGFMVAGATFDLLGVRAKPEVLPALIADPDVSELTLGIVAVVACEAIGRSYLATTSLCVDILVKVLTTHRLDSAQHVQALAALQRLSLRRRPQDRMIELGLVEWAVSVLAQKEGAQGMPSEFGLEFASALLMNLALRTAGKRRCMQLGVLTVSLNLMEHWNAQIRTHINGAVYSLLSVPAFRAEAQKAGLEIVLQSMHDQATSLGDEVSLGQAEYLLEKLHATMEEQSDGTQSGEEDEDDDENFLEEEELAGLILGDRSGHAAEEALGRFAASDVVVESQVREMQEYMSRMSVPR